ncbi:polyprenyl synthetase family protein [Candidatus Woesearchaeota archaeon]|nr:polyprenyl synthetase family protein [Candidatus Woesearchaeota archaeon]
MDFESYKHREDVEKALHEFLPDKITAEWVEKAVGKARWSQDVTALTKAISEPVWDFLQRGGKRFRPIVMLMCCEAVGGNPEKILPFAVIPELIHNGSLIVDDIEDNSDLRRGKPVLHRIFGVDIAVNAGNTLYFLPYIIIRDSALPAETKKRAYEIISTELLKCHFGQAIDIWWHSGKSDTVPTEDEYLQMCANKSGSLACMTGKLGALLGGGSNRQVEALGNFGQAAGVVFQIRDDILNIAENSRIGKEFGDDIKEGKRTLLVIHTLNSAGKDERERLLDILNMHTKDERLLGEAVNIIKKSGSIAYAENVARQITENAWHEVDAALPESEAKSQLKELAELLIHRSV